MRNVMRIVNKDCANEECANERNEECGIWNANEENGMGGQGLRNFCTNKNQGVSFLFDAKKIKGLGMFRAK